MTNGIYKHEHFQHYAECDLFVGDILIDVKETAKSFILSLISNCVRYDAPQIDDMFRGSVKVIISKFGSKHALRDWGDDSFMLYPYRVGVPYLFKKIGNGGDVRSEKLDTIENKMFEFCPYCGAKMRTKEEQKIADL